MLGGSIVEALGERNVFGQHVDIAATADRGEVQPDFERAKATGILDAVFVEIDARIVVLILETVVLRVEAECIR